MEPKLLEPIYSREKNYVVFKVTGALLFSMLAGMTFFYSIWYQNFNSAVWCLPLEMTCIVILVFNKLYEKDELHHHYNSSFFRAVKYVALVFCAGAACAAVAYIVRGIERREFDLLGFGSEYLLFATPVAFVAGFWCLILFFDAKKYENLLAEQETTGVSEKLRICNGI